MYTEAVEADWLAGYVNSRGSLTLNCVAGW
jgi:hypothetical protein